MGEIPCMNSLTDPYPHTRKTRDTWTGVMGFALKLDDGSDHRAMFCSPRNASGGRQTNRVSARVAVVGMLALVACGGTRQPGSLGVSPSQPVQESRSTSPSPAQVSFDTLQVEAADGSYEPGCDGAFSAREQVKVSGAGYSPDSSIYLRFVGAGIPDIDLGQTIADGAGSIEALVSLPGRTESPSTGIEAVGEGPDGTIRVLVAPVLIAEPGSPCPS
jgi:hypothetical protein